MNPEKNRFCSSCGRHLPEPLTSPGTSPVGSLPRPVTPASRGPGLWMVLLGGGALFLVVLVVAGLLFILPMFEEGTPVAGEPGGSYSGDTAGPETYKPGADLSESSSAVPAATLNDAQPVQGGTGTSPDDLIIGTWDIQSSAMQIQFGGDGTATLVDPVSKEYSPGSWERISEGRYRLRSSSGTEYAVLLLDPIAGTMYAEDYSLVFTGKD